jgi:Fucose dissimilation pathway protein FucU
MLRGVSPLITPGLLGALAAMGHGDVMAIVDRNYPAARHPRVLDAPGCTTTTIAEAILELLPVDDFATPAAWRMVPTDDPGFLGDSQRAFAQLIARAEGREFAVAPVERVAFYEAATRAFAVVHTGDDRPYSCFLLTKGVI